MTTAQDARPAHDNSYLSTVFTHKSTSFMSNKN